MSHKRFATLVLGVSILAILNVIAFAGIAQALEWTIKGKTFKELSLKEETLETTTELSYELTVPKLSVTIKCGQAADSTNHISEGGTSGVTVEFYECETVKLPVCKPKEPIIAKVKDKLIEFKSKIYDQLEPLKAEEPFTIIEFKSEECALPEKSKITGTLAGKTSGISTTDQSLIFSEAISKEVGSKLMFGANEVFFKSTLSSVLSGKTNASQEWSAK